MSAELALHGALIARLKADAALGVLVGPRIWDVAPRGAGFPQLLTGRCEGRPVGADGGLIEHMVTLTAVSTFEGTEEARAIVAAVRVALNDAPLEADGVKAVSCGVRFADVYPAPRWGRTHAVMRVRIVTEEMP